MNFYGGIKKKLSIILIYIEKTFQQKKHIDWNVLIFWELTLNNIFMYNMCR